MYLLGVVFGCVVGMFGCRFVGGDLCGFVVGGVGLGVGLVGGCDVGIVVV